MASFFNAHCAPRTAQGAGSAQILVLELAQAQAQVNAIR